MKIVTLLLFSVFAFSEASQVKMVSNLQVSTIEELPGVLRITGTVENEGNGAVSSLKLEWPKTGKTISEVGPLTSGEEKEVTVDISEAELGISKEGNYQIPLRLLYTDENKNAFSTAVLLTYSKKKGILKPSPVIVGVEPEVQKTGSADIAGEGNVAFVLQNQSTQKVTAHLEALTSKELEITFPQTSYEIEPSKEQVIFANVKSTNGIKGTSYASYIIVSGTMDDQVFSEYVSFAINLTATKANPWLMTLFVVLAIVFAFTGVIFYKQDRGPKIAEVGDAIPARASDEDIESPRSDFPS